MTTETKERPEFAHATHGDPETFISITRARLVARYRMTSIPGRPEELVTKDRLHVVSFAYCGGEMRLRKHGGADNREWVEVRDFQLRDGWLSEVYDFLDDWIGYISPRDIKAPRFNHPNTGDPL